MHSSIGHAPWQLAPVSAPARVTAAALAALALDSLFSVHLTPHIAQAIVFTTIPALVAIRVIRGFKGSIIGAAATFVGALFLGVITRAPGGQPRPLHVPAAVLVAMMLATTGLTMIAVERIRTRRSRPPVIAIAMRDRSARGSGARAVQVAMDHDPASMRPGKL